MCWNPNDSLQQAGGNHISSPWRGEGRERWILKNPGQEEGDEAAARGGNFRLTAASMLQKCVCPNVIGHRLMPGAVVYSPMEHEEGQRQYLKQTAGFLSGLAGGLLGGFLGVGGGAVMVPLMTHFLKLTQHQAHGTSLVAIVFTAAVGAATYTLHGDTDWKGALILAVTAIFTARFGALFAHSLPEKKLKKAFGAFLVFVSLLLLLKPYLPTTGQTLAFWGSLLVFLGIGALTGFISGMMGVGGGAVMVPPMVIIGNMTQHLAQGTSLLAMIPIGVSGAITHYKLGNVRKDVMWGLAAGALMGGWLGAAGAKALPDAYLRFVFTGIGLLMGMRYLKT
jgi:uncharacterized protein